MWYGKEKKTLKHKDRVRQTKSKDENIQYKA